MAHDVFISYASTDKPIADLVCAALESSGTGCWIAPRDIPPGQTYSKAITQAIHDSRIMVVIFSARANQSNQVIREVERAVHNKTIIIPFRVEDVKPSEDMEYFISITHWLDALSEPRDRAFQHLVRTVLKILDADPSDPLPEAASKFVAQVPSLAAKPANKAEAQPTVAEAPIPVASGESLRVTLLYKRNSEPDEHVLKLLEGRLKALGYTIFIDRHLSIGVQWAKEIERQIREADAVIPLLSAGAVSSDMLAYEIQTAHESRQQQNGKPRLLPVRVAYDGPLPEPIAHILNAFQYSLWQDVQDDERLAQEIIHSLRNPQAAIKPLPHDQLEPVGGAVPLDSAFYIVRRSDEEFATAITRHDSIVLVKGARQIGKTSLLARGLQRARESGARCIRTDFQKLTTAAFQTEESLYMMLADLIAEQLDLEVFPQDVWNPRRLPSVNFESYIRREALRKSETQVVWALDEVDKLFACPFGGDVFALFRSWHNDRAMDPQGPWSKLTLAIAYATEAHLFITDLNQSPFNVGTRLTLEDFTVEQVTELNRRYNGPLRNAEEIARFHALVGGQPYLVRRGLDEMAAHSVSFAEMEAKADRDEGIFGDHLRRLLVSLSQDAEMTEIVRQMLRDQTLPNAACFYRLRSGGLLGGASENDFHLRCELYGRYLERHLL